MFRKNKKQYSFTRENAISVVGDAIMVVMADTRAEIVSLQKEVELLRANQNSDIHNWWVAEHGCWLRRNIDGYDGLQRSLVVAACGKNCGWWQYRTPNTLEWKDVGPDLSEAIKEIEAGED